MTVQQMFPFFVVFWVMLAIGSAVFYWRAPLASKRRWHPRIVIGGGLAFAVFVTIAFPLLPVLLIAVPGIALVTYLNLRFTNFCPRCGTMQFNRNWFARMDFCQSCGASLREGVRA